MGLGDHPETFLLKALCCQSAPSWLKVIGGWSGPCDYCVSQVLIIGDWGLGIGLDNKTTYVIYVNGNKSKN